MQAAVWANNLRRYRYAVAVAVCMLIAATAQGQVRREAGTASNSGGLSGITSVNSTQQGGQMNGPFPNDSNYTDTSATKGLVFAKETPDSVLRKKVFFFHYTPQYVKIDEVWNPTLDPTGVQYFNDPLDAFNGTYYLGQGTIGHPHVSIYDTPAEKIEYSLQPHGMDGYLKTPENIRFYQTLTPYTVLSYNNSLNKDYLVQVAHTQNIIPGWNVAMDYRLICPEGNLSGSGAKNHYLDFTTNYFSPDSRLQVLAGFIWQSFNMEENGGLSDDSYFTSNHTSNLGGLPVKLYNSSSKNLHHNLFVHATYNMVQQVDKLRHRDSLAVRYDTVSADSIVMVMDTIEIVDTIRVGTPRVVNAGIIGIDADYARWKRAAYLSNYSDSLLWNNANATLFWTNDAYPDYRWRNPLKITIGITPRIIHAIVTTDTTAGPDTLQTKAVVNPFAKVELSLGRTVLTAEGMLDNTLTQLSKNIEKPDYIGTVSYRIPFDSTDNTGVEIMGSMQSLHPDIRMLNHSHYTLDAIQSEHFGLHLFHSSDSGFFRLVDLCANATHMNHEIWYDSALTIHVGQNDLWLYQAAISLQLQWGWFHVDMQQLLQHTTDHEQIQVPLLASKNSIYADFNLFHRALRMQVGADIRYFSRFEPDCYDPATGGFYSQSTETGDCFWGDIFINLQVKRASIYLKAGHLNAVWESHPRYFLMPHYPGNRFGLFWGMTWNFFD